MDMSSIIMSFYFYLLLLFFFYFLSISFSLCDHGESHKAGPGWIYQSSSMYNVFQSSHLGMIGLGGRQLPIPAAGGPVLARLAAGREPRAKRMASDRVNSRQS